jgi:beta-mannosidase
MTKLPPEVRGILEPVVSRALDTGWRLARAGDEAWHEAQVPGTVAGSLHGDLDLPGDYDAHDWRYATTFPRPAAGDRHYLRFEGLATLAHVWLNGEKILESRNMFLGHRVEVTELLRDTNELTIEFLALDRELAKRRPRPRWKTRLVERQALRWIRTTLLGRIPAWTPAVPVVGPWGPVLLESVFRADVSDVSIRTSVEGGVRGRVTFTAKVRPLDNLPLTAARLRVGDATAELSIRGDRIEGDRIEGEVTIDDPPRWWPHTHGEPALLDCRLELDLGDERVAMGCGRVGFRQITLDTARGSVRFLVNGTPVFCRGAVWTPLDILRLRATPGPLRAALTQLRDAGANMVRVGGTMTYESDEFYALCDELGLMVWQDFMFANMDYPVGDAAFRAEAEAEASYQVTRLAQHPCIAAWCGGSEVAQQAAMQGLGAEAWGGELFEKVLPAIVERHLPGTPYFPSSPWGGALPFQVGAGIAHYYGVGAYRRPLTDVKHAGVKFATECLGFSNIPEGPPSHPPHHPRWKGRVPRDNGAGYDFEDVRDHYLRALFGRDPVQLRAADLERYYATSRVTSGEVMAQTYSEWRARGSACGGALVWLHRDLWDGAGWGIVAADGTPKSPYWYLKRAWASVAVRLTDEGLDGFAAHVINESPRPLEARLEIACYRDGLPTEDRGEATIDLGPRDAATLSVDAILGRFTDATHAYNFGPPKQDVVVARLLVAATGEVLSEDACFPGGHDVPRVAGAKVEAAVRRLADGAIEASLVTDRFLQAVSVECAGYRPSDNYFHLAPQLARRILFKPLDAAPRPFSAWLQPLNAPGFTLRAPMENPDAA